MSRPFPYTFISCPCADTPVPDHLRKRSERESPRRSHLASSHDEKNEDREEGDDHDNVDDEEEEEEEEEEGTFDPRSPRANFSLFPPEQLLYCEDCHEIKCPRCITEEIVSWYCPNCLFETPSSMVRSEGNRYVFFGPFRQGYRADAQVAVRETASAVPYALLPWQSAVLRMPQRVAARISKAPGF